MIKDKNLISRFNSLLSTRCGHLQYLQILKILHKPLAKVKSTLASYPTVVICFRETKVVFWQNSDKDVQHHRQSIVLASARSPA